MDLLYWTICPAWHLSQINGGVAGQKVLRVGEARREPGMSRRPGMAEKGTVFNSSDTSPEKCIFCRIVAGKAPSEVVYQDEDYIAFLDAHPFSRGHTLVCPKRHGVTIWDMKEEETAGLFRVASRVSKAVVNAVRADGFRFVQNNGEAANQVVAHVHVHVIPVKMETKDRFPGRQHFGQDEMEETARSIRELMRAQTEPAS
jgi:histidine triad (HIT) family protein